MKIEQDKVALELRKDFERRMHELHSVYDDRQNRLREEMGRDREEEVRRLAIWLRGEYLGRRQSELAKSEKLCKRAEGRA